MKPLKNITRNFLLLIINIILLLTILCSCLCSYAMSEAIYIAYYCFLLAYGFNIFFLEAKLGLFRNSELLNTIAICMTDKRTFTLLLILFTPKCRMSSVISKMGFLFLDQGFPKLLAPVCIMISVCCSGTGFYYQVFWRALLYDLLSREPLHPLGMPWKEIKPFSVNCWDTCPSKVLQCLFQRQ